MINRNIIFSLVGISAFFIFAITHSINAKSSTILDMNIEALAGEESSGWLWKKEWFSCPIEGQIIVSIGCGSISSGTYAYSTALMTSLEQCGGSYTVVGGHDGLKSYCFDGWTPWCSKDECR